MTVSTIDFLMMSLRLSLVSVGVLEFSVQILLVLVVDVDGCDVIVDGVDIVQKLSIGLRVS